MVRITFIGSRKYPVPNFATSQSEGTLAENFDQRCRKIACRQKTELSKELEETVSILTG